MKGNVMTMKKAIPAALLLAGSLGLSANASASAYGIAYNNVFGLEVTSTDSDGNNGPFYLELDDIRTFGTDSQSAASMGPLGIPVAGVSSTENANGPADADLSYAPGSIFAGGVPANNAMTAQGQVGGSYSYGDAQISQTTLSVVDGEIAVTAPSTQAWAIAEGYVSGNTAANSSGSNGSVTGITTTFESSTDAIFSFAFNADAYLEVALGADLGANNKADATISVIISITDENNLPVFQWAPNGQAGGIFGGTELSDDFSLNNSVEVTSAGASVIEDLAGNGAPSGNINPGSFGEFAATTNVIGPGVYTISINMDNSVDLTASSVPAPQPLALIGLALAGLGMSRRRK